MNNEKKIQTAIQQVGDEVVVIIPESILEELNLREGDSLEVSAEPGKITLTPIKVKE